ncbi:hypothetical protein TRFO_06746 [Tritrichomonas foetus]|uniref:Uncharacterized protein n=1 Tax=Tritrichomonas foetus TaxID=1144522 RepID=A0A1J4JVR5_9EUKA|nr:hypothetical protein TRFO_06746 [Tritrichomonas foetus]|eukprot:OHT03107.1 hypothetical protein TRFO_06746 [Tritrichomonas foetus]
MSSTEENIQQLDIIYILLATVIRPIDKPFQSQPFSVADHQRHVYSVCVQNGKGILSSGAPIARPPPDFPNQVSTSDDDCPDELKEIAEALKPITEEVNDIEIKEFVLQFSSKEGECPTLIGCAGSLFAPSPQLEPFMTNDLAIPIFTLFYAAEMSVSPIQSQCITRGKYCSGGTQSVERSKIISYHISCIAHTLKEKNLNQYLKSRINSLCPVIMMSNVSVCAQCFKFYSVEASQSRKPAGAGRECGTATLSDHNRSLIVRKENRPTTTFANRNNGNNDPKSRTMPVRSTLPIIRPPQPPYQIGNYTSSGLRVASDRSTVALELARQTYKGVPFIFVPPPKPEAKFRYRPKSTALK